MVSISVNGSYIPGGICESRTVEVQEIKKLNPDNKNVPGQTDIDLYHNTDLGHYIIDKDNIEAKFYSSSLELFLKSTKNLGIPDEDVKKFIIMNEAVHAATYQCFAEQEANMDLVALGNPRQKTLILGVFEAVSNYGSLKQFISPWNGKGFNHGIVRSAYSADLPYAVAQKIISGAIKTSLGEQTILRINNKLKANKLPDFNEDEAKKLMQTFGEQLAKHMNALVNYGKK